MTQTQRARCLIAIGSNLGDSSATVQQAIQTLGQLSQLHDIAISSLHRSKPVGGPSGQPEFTNAAATITSDLTPQQLLKLLHSIEGEFGRERSERWAMRTLDLDLLLVDQQIVVTPTLCLPHPRMSFRPFMLDPAVEVAGDWTHPLLGASLSALHHRLHLGDHAAVVYGGSNADRQWHIKQVLGLLPEASLVDQSFEASVVAWGGGEWAAPRLAIRLLPKWPSGGQQPIRPGLPTLSLPAEGRAQVLDELRAAIACVWPDLCSGKVER